MTLRMDLWQVDGQRLDELPPKDLDVEERLESWIANDPSILGMDLLIVGQQVITSFQGRIDLLALDREANTVVLELKKGRTPRDVVGQMLDYASWVTDLSYKDVDDICTKYRSQDLATAFESHFGESIPDTVNDDHQLVIVAPQLDDSSERIVLYLSGKLGLAINVVFFNVFEVQGMELLGRAWLQDPTEVEEKAGSKRRPPWPGYWFVNVGEGHNRTWEDNVRYGFIGAGQGEKYSKPLKHLREGDPIFAYLKGEGYVGFGHVTSEAQMIREFEVDGTPLLQWARREATASRSGRKFSNANVNEMFSDALLEAYAAHLSTDSLQRAWAVS